jgi:hypothetical protein
MTPSPVAQLLMQAKLREFAGFLALPAEQLAHAMAIAGGDPVRITAAVNIMTADPGAESIALPRSWRRAEHQTLWDALPPTIQEIIAERERSRDREVRMKQDECAKAKQELERLRASLQPAADEQQQPTKREPENGKEA